METVSPETRKPLRDICVFIGCVQLSIPLEKCSLFGVSLHPIPEKEASLSGTECSAFMGNN